MRQTAGMLAWPRDLARRGVQGVICSGILMAAVAVLVAFGACGNDAPARKSSERLRPGAAELASEANPAPPPAAACKLMPFAPTSPVPEASGAVVLDLQAGEPRLLVVGDSGTEGAYAIVDGASGNTLATGRLPLGRGASDDLEGLAMDRGQVVALTSSGWVRHWRVVRGATPQFELVAGPYAIDAAADLAACPATKVNCGANYEGLCLRHGDVAPGACVGFAASKQRDELVCVVRQGARLALDASRTISIAGRQALAACDFDPTDEAIWTGANAFGAFSVFRITHWEARAEVTWMGALGSGFPEALAVAPGGLVYRFSDTGKGPSSQWKFQCR